MSTPPLGDQLPLLSNPFPAKSGTSTTCFTHLYFHVLGSVSDDPSIASMGSCEVGVYGCLLVLLAVLQLLPRSFNCRVTVAALLVLLAVSRRLSQVATVN